MSRARFSAEFILRAYKSSAFLFCFFGFILIEFGFYLNPIFKFGVIKIIGMIFVFLLQCLSGVIFLLENLVQ